MLFSLSLVESLQICPEAAEDPDPTSQAQLVVNSGPAIAVRETRNALEIADSAMSDGCGKCRPLASCRGYFDNSPIPGRPLMSYKTIGHFLTLFHTLIFLLFSHGDSRIFSHCCRCASSRDSHGPNPGRSRAHRSPPGGRTVAVPCRGTCDVMRFVRKAGTSFPDQGGDPQAVALQGLLRDSRKLGRSRPQAMEFVRPKSPS
jgi:hypothetical protein